MQLDEENKRYGTMLSPLVFFISSFFTKPMGHQVTLEAVNQAA
jgi:hypothetical protein